MSARNITVHRHNPATGVIESDTRPSVGVSAETVDGPVRMAQYMEGDDRLVISLHGTGVIDGTKVYVDGVLMRLVEA